jgi:hypothetical protein
VLSPQIQLETAVRFRAPLNLLLAIGKVVFTAREHIIAVEARGKGLLGVTLRYPYQVRNEADHFMVALGNPCNGLPTLNLQTAFRIHRPSCHSSRP